VKQEKNVKKDILLRIYLVYFATILFSLFVLGKIIKIQFFEGDEWRKISIERNFRYNDIKAIRGNILSSDGKQLVLSKPVYDIYFDPLAENLVKDTAYYKKNILLLADSLQKHFGINKKIFLKEINNIRKPEGKKNRHYSIKKNIGYEQLELIKTFPIFNKGQSKGGFIEEEKYVPDYPFGTLAKRTLGIADNKKYGINWFYDKELSGTVGMQYEQRMKGGDWLPVNSDSTKRIEPKNGYDVVTTINFKIQDFAESELSKKIVEHNAKWGSIVLMEVATGQIRAIANLSYDTATGKISENENYAVANLMEPGSTFKLATLMAAHEDGFIKINDTIDCEGGKMSLYGADFEDTHPSRRISVRDIFKVSSNIGAAKIVEKYYNCKKPNETNSDRFKKRQKFINRLYDMRLNQSVNTEIENEPRPRIKNFHFSNISLLKMAYGYELQMTPLQILTFYNAVANDGKMMKPMFVSEIREGDRVIKKIEPTVLKERIASKETIEFAKNILDAVVKEGTAKAISDTKYYEIAGKTGTSKINHGTEGYDQKKYYISSFVGYFPKDKPKYSCIVIIYEPKKSGYYGAVVSAPVFRAIADKVYTSELAVFTEKDIPYTPDNNPPLKIGFQKDFQKIYTKLGINAVSENPQSEWTRVEEKDRIVELKNSSFANNIVPNVIGMSFKDAIYLLENKGFKIHFTGKGTVKEQKPNSGEAFKKGDIITLTLSL